MTCLRWKRCWGGSCAFRPVSWKNIIPAATAYFLQYVLGLRPRRRAELSADQSGTLMHWVLQMALDPHPGPDNPMAALQPFMELDDEAMAGLAALLVDEYAKRYLPEDTARFAYLLSRLKKS